MPELPGVETTVRDLKKKVLGRTFIDTHNSFYGLRVPRILDKI